jgi:CRP/FNR family transcriptional regulator, cyclic AMP receptor protein
MEKDQSHRFLIAHPSDTIRAELTEAIKLATGGKSTFFYASDGVEVGFKMSNAPPDVVFLAYNLAKRSADQVMDSILESKTEKDLKTAIVILGPIPEHQRHVDAVVSGRVQYLLDFKDTTELEKCLDRTKRFNHHGEQATFQTQTYEAGHVLMTEGDKARFVYLVIHGQMRAVKNADGKEVILGPVMPGEFVGELAYINGKPRSATVIADTQIEVVQIAIESFDQVLLQHPAWSKALMRTLSKRLDSAIAGK